MLLLTRSNHCAKALSCRSSWSLCESWGFNDSECSSRGSLCCDNWCLATFLEWLRWNVSHRWTNTALYMSVAPQKKNLWCMMTKDFQHCLPIWWWICFWDHMGNQLSPVTVSEKCWLFWICHIQVNYKLMHFKRIIIQRELCMCDTKKYYMGNFGLTIHLLTLSVSCCGRCYFYIRKC